MNTNRAYVHSVDLEFKSAVLALNHTAHSLSDAGGSKSATLRRLLGREYGNYLTIYNNVALFTSEPATVVAPQVIDWSLPNNCMLIWPLDDSVYICKVTRVGEFTVVEPGTEEVTKPEDAHKLADQHAGPIYVSSGGHLTNEFIEYTTDDIDREAVKTLKTGMPYATQGAFIVFTKHLVFHGTQLLALFGLLVFAYLLLIIFSSFTSPDEDVLPTAVIIKPTVVNARLSHDIDFYLSQLRQTEFLSMHGAASFEYTKEKQYVLRGELNLSNVDRLVNSLASAGYEYPSMGSNRWSSKLISGSPTGFGPHEPGPINQELQRFLKLVRQTDAVPSVGSSRALVGGVVRQEIGLTFQRTADIAHFLTVLDRAQPQFSARMSESVTDMDRDSTAFTLLLHGVTN